MNPTITISLTVTTAQQAIDAYWAITAACGPVASVTVSPVQTVAPAPVQPIAVQSSACSSACSSSASSRPTTEEQELREEYKQRHPDGRGYRPLKAHIALHKSDPIQYPKIKFLREAVAQLRAGTFVVQAEESEPEQDTSLEDGGDIY